MIATNDINFLCKIKDDFFNKQDAVPGIQHVLVSLKFWDCFIGSCDVFSDAYICIIHGV